MCPDEDSIVYLSPEEAEEKEEKWRTEKRNSQFDPFFHSILKQYFIPEIAFEPLYDFGFRFGSLQRYFEYTYRYLKEYLDSCHKYLKKLTEDKQVYAEDVDFYGERFYADEHYLMEILYCSILSHLFSLLETLLGDIANDVAKMANKDINTRSSRF